MRTVSALARILLHRLIDEVVDGTLELARHLLERIPLVFSALKGAGAFLVRITHGCALIVTPSRDCAERFLSRSVGKRGLTFFRPLC